MNKIQPPSNNGVLGAPAGWDQGDLPAVVSYWHPSAEELAVLNSGGYITLWVLGATMPPVNLSIESA